MTSFAFTYFPSLLDAHGKRVATSWPKLLSRLTVARTVTTKEDAPGLSLATFQGDRRSLATVEHVYAVGLDLDKQVDWDALLFLFDNVDSFLHTTWSSTEDAPRARVFLRLSRPVTGDEYRRCYTAVVARCEGRGLVVDRKASDPSRFWFLPSTRPGGTYRYSVGQGKPVNVDWALTAVPPPEPPAAPPPPSDRGPAGDVEARAAAYLARCEPAIQGSGGDALTFVMAQRIVRGFALDEDTSFRLLCDWNARCSPPWSDGGLRRKVRDAASRGTLAYGSLRDAQRMRRAS